MNEAELRQRLTVLEARARDAAAEAEADNEYWTLRESGQDTEEAEASGVLSGYVDGLKFAVDLLQGRINPEGQERYDSTSREALAAYKREQFEMPDDVGGTVFDPNDATFAPILGAIQAGEFSTAARLLLEVEART